MVKTPFGRKPGPKHARIVKKLRHRRRMTRLQHEQPQVEIVEAVSCEVLAPAPELPHSRIYFTPSKEAADITYSLENVNDAPPPAPVEDHPVVPYNGFATVPGVKMVYRGASEVAVAGNTGPVVERNTVSESSVPQPSAFTSTPAVVVAEAERPQHPNEQTDEYLADLFTVSPIGVTTADEPTQDTRSEDYSRLRNLLSSDSQHTSRRGTSAEVATVSIGNLFKTASCDTSLGLNTLFHEKTASREKISYKPGLPTVLSDASLHLNTLFNNKTSACDTTSMGLRTLFEEKEEDDHPQIKSSGSASDLVSKTVHGTDEPTTYTVTSPSACITCNHCKSMRELPAVTASSSLLGNLFGSTTDVHHTGDNDEVIIANERKKALIAKDLADYLKSDDDRTHPKSTTLSTFVQQIEALFGNYRAAVLELENLKREMNKE